MGNSKDPGEETEKPISFELSGAAELRLVEVVGQNELKRLVKLRAHFPLPSQETPGQPGGT